MGEGRPLAMKKRILTGAFVCLLSFPFGVTAGQHESSAVPHNEWEEEYNVLLQQYNQELNESNIMNLLLWTFSSFGMLFAIALIYQDRLKRVSYKLQESKDSLLIANQQVATMRNSESKYEEEILVLKKQVEQSHRMTNEQLGIGKQLYDKIREGGQLSLTDDESLFIKYYSVLHYETYSQWMSDYEHLTDRLVTFLILRDMGKTDDEIKQTLRISDVAFRATKSRINRKKRK